MPRTVQFEDELLSSTVNRNKTTFATTMNYLSNQEFAARVCTMVRRPPPGRLMDGLAILWQVLKTAVREERLLLSSSWGSIHPELLACMVIGLWPKRWRPRVYLLGCMWEPDKRLRGLIEHVVVKLADRAIDRYIVQSTEELTVFPEIWGISQSKVRFCPFFYSFTEKDLRRVGRASRGDYVFSGGNSLRDYEPLVEAARCLPERKFIIATKLLDGRDDLPPNIEAKPVSHQQFVSLMANSAATVVPIQPGLRRAAGQQTYLNAMWLGKPTVVNDTLGVRDHIRHKETGLIVNGSAGSYVEALNWIFSPHNRDAVERLNLAARQDVQERFSFDCHIDCLLDLMDEDL